MTPTNQPPLGRRDLEKTLGQVAYDAAPVGVKLYGGHISQENWGAIASAVVAAHEARKGETEVVTRWAYQASDGAWWTGNGWSGGATYKSPRALYPVPLQVSPGGKLVEVPTRRRVRAK